MQPGHITDVKELARKDKVMREHLATAHWPLKSKIFGKPRVYGAPKAGDERATYDFSPVLLPSIAEFPILQHFMGVKQIDGFDILAGQWMNKGAHLAFGAPPGQGIKRTRSGDDTKPTKTKRARVE